MKICPSCKLNEANKSGRCSECNRKRIQEIKEKNPNYFASKTDRGVPMWAAEYLFSIHDKKCYICEKHAQLIDASPDGIIRGVLCKSCKRGLGAFEDNPQMLHRAKEYLNRVPEREVI